MKRNLLFAVLAITGFLFGMASCQKAPELTLTGPTNFELSADGGSASISFTSSRDWTATSSSSWLTITPPSGTASNGPITLSIYCAPNNTYEERSGTVTIKAEDLTQSIMVKQSENLGVVIPIQSFEIPSATMTINVDVKANVQYLVSISSKWIKQVETKGLRVDRLSFSIEENETFTAREGTITIKPQSGGDPVQTVKVKQAGRIAVESISVSPSSVSLLEGESMTLSAMVSPSNAYDKTVVWKSSNSSIATISETGYLSAKNRGSATITASCGGESATCQVTVTYMPQEEIWYTSSDGKIVTPYKSTAFYPQRYTSSSPLSIESNTYENGKGIIRFSGPIVAIGQAAFELRNNLVSVTIPKGVLELGYAAFYRCDHLKKANLPDGLTMNGAVFDMCYELSEVILPTDLKSIPAYCFEDCRALRELTIPNTVESIGKNAFYCCPLSSITIPQNVNTIGEGAFEKCYSLSKIVVLAETPPTGNDRMFDTSDCPIYVPSESVEAYKTAAFWSFYSSRIEAIPE